MSKNKKILLYRIDEQAKNVIFVVTEDNESVWRNISGDAYSVISFDDIFRDITEFRNGFLDYEQLTDELIGAINGRAAVYSKILERFDDNRLNSFNFFTRYYSDTLRDLFTETRKNIEKAGAFLNTRALKKSTEHVSEVFNHIREVMRDDWNFDFNSESDIKAFRLSFDKIIIRGNDRNDIYTVADTALVNFFYDFSFAIHKLKLYVCDCKYCSQKFLGIRNSVCCDAEECQNVYQREIKNAKRRSRENSTYKIYSTRLSNYIGQQKTKLSSGVLDNPLLVERFDRQRKVFTAFMTEKLSEYEMDHRLPDKELDAFYDKMKQDVMSFVYGLEAEAE
ncbi:hypothetical protein [Ruminococcus sp. HUN007]|uniref:hypothetical protein n=1 Tax=Ruminococcus sp. HUN007 TaxID=1514668 RepID=UPI0005D1F75E|nr:hypothetical protein [Ruminococcus sp. HUN007]